MKIYDISMEIRQDMPLYKDQEQYRPVIKVCHDFHSGNYYQTSILEGLRLREVEDGDYLPVAVPLNIMEVEAAPVRAVLVRF